MPPPLPSPTNLFQLSPEACLFLLPPPSSYTSWDELDRLKPEGGLIHRHALAPRDSPSPAGGAVNRRAILCTNFPRPRHPVDQANNTAIRQWMDGWMDG